MPNWIDFFRNLLAVIINKIDLYSKVWFNQSFVMYYLIWISSLFLSLIFYYAGSPADKAGLKPGDRILFLNGLDMRFCFQSCINVMI